MKYKKIILVAVSLFAVETYAGLTSPKQGILCDEYVCANQNGLSKDLTGNYLDQTRAKSISGKGADITQFTYSDGTYCDAQVKKCYVDRYFDSNGQRSAVAQYATQRLFGSAAVTQQASNLKSPTLGVLCDEYACADKNGLSKSLTANYLDQTKAKKITGSGTDLTQFTFSNGTFCDVKVKTCYVDRYFDSNGRRSSIDAYATKRLFNR